MVELKRMNINEFNKELYKYYKKLFPPLERKSKVTIENTYKSKILEILGVFSDKVLVGFMLTNSTDNNKYLQLDYLAIFPKYQNIGFGTKSVKLLKELKKEYNGIFIEVETEGLGKTESDNKNRARRAKFYDKLNFEKLSFNLELYSVKYTPYMLKISQSNDSNNDVINSMFNIYAAVVGEKSVKKHCKIIM